MTKRSLLIGTLAIVCVVSLTLSSTLQAQEKKVFKWKLHGAFARGDASFEALYPFVKELKKRSNGRLDLTVFPANAIIPPRDLVTACGQGVIEAYHSSGLHYTGIIPEGRLEGGLPFMYKGMLGSLKGPDDIWYKHGLSKLMREAYAPHNVHHLAYHTYSAMVVQMFNKPYQGMNSWKDVKMRAHGSFAWLYEELGAKPMYLPSPEIYMAMKLGTVDACIYDISGVSGLKLHEVFTNLWMPTFNDHGLGHIGVNKKAWDSLPPDLQKILFDTAKGYLNETTLNAYTKIWDEVLTKAPQLGFKVDNIPQKDLEVIRKTAVEKVWPRAAASTPRCAKMLDIFFDYYGWKK